MQKLRATSALKTYNYLGNVKETEERNENTTKIVFKKPAQHHRFQSKNQQKTSAMGNNFFSNGLEQGKERGNGEWKKIIGRKINQN